MSALTQYWHRQTSHGYTIARTSPQAARKNILHAAGLTLLFNVSILVALVVWSLWPLLFGLLLFLSSVQRIALQSRDKGRIRDRFVHSLKTHLSQVPIFIGQLNYRTRRKK